MRTNEVIENNKKLQEQFNGFKDEKSIRLATLSVLTDISETMALFTDLFANIYGRQIMNNEERK